MWRGTDVMRNAMFVLWKHVELYLADVPSTGQERLMSLALKRSEKDALRHEAASAQLPHVLECLARLSGTPDLLFLMVRSVQDLLQPREVPSRGV
jgi:hypothetical protein